jgi:hypothetical protein
MGLVVLAMSVELRYFWLVLILVNILFATHGIASALVTALTPQASLGTGISLLKTITWVGASWASQEPVLLFKPLEQRLLFRLERYCFC